jgi:hypothetical protein
MLAPESIAATLLAERLPLTAFVASVTGDFHLAEDVFHEVCVKAIALGSAQVTTLGGSGDAWKHLTAKSLVSAEADFAVVQISARPNLRVPMPPQLFVDDVKLTLKTQPSLPVRVVKR